MPEESMTKSGRRQKQKWCLLQITEQSAASVKKSLLDNQKKVKKSETEVEE